MLTSTPAPPSTISNDPQGLPPPPVSSVNLYELSFGTVCGVCAGVFVKKGAKALAFFLGGIFVLLQVSFVVSTLFVELVSNANLVPRVSLAHPSQLGRRGFSVRKPFLQGRRYREETGSIDHFIVDLVGEVLDCRFPAKGFFHCWIVIGFEDRVKV